MDPTTLDIGHRAWEHVRELHARDRWSTTPAYAESSAYCAEALRSAGVEEVEREPFPADGRTKFGDWMMPLAWDVRDATLSVAGVQPRLLARYRNAPQCLVMWSAPTPPEGVEAELVLLEHGTREEVERADVRGKIVFTPAHPTPIKAAVARAGGLGIVSDWLKAKDLPDARQWINTWSDAPGGWAMHAHDTRLWGFTLTPRQGAELRREALRSPVRLRAQVDSRLYEGDLHTVTGVIRGGSDEEILLTAHINEQGANDNAAGAAALLEAARLLTETWQPRRAGLPSRTIRVLLMPESYGTMTCVVRHPERLRRTFLALNVDSGAGDGDHEDSTLDVTLNPLCCPSYGDALLAGMALIGGDPTERGRVRRYMLAGDNFLCDPLIGVPNPWIAMGDGGDYWHNTADTPERVDPRSLQRLVGFVHLFSHYMDRPTDLFQEKARAARMWLPADVRSLLHFGDDPLAAPASISLPHGEAVFRRTLVGPLTFDGVPPERWGPVNTSPRWWGPRLAAWWWVDGRRSLGEIAALVQREFGTLPDDLQEFFTTLEDLGYVQRR